MILYGASGHAKVILDILERNGIVPDEIIDDNPAINELLGVKVTTKNDDLSENDDLIISIGNNRIRKQLADSLTVHFATAVHPTAVIAGSAKLGRGTVVMAQAAVNTDAVIGEHCIINTGSVIEHDCILGDFVHISPKAALAGNVTVGEGSHIGIGACVIQGVTIGKWATVGAGAVIIRNVPDRATVVGNPGRIIKRGNA